LVKATPYVSAASRTSGLAEPGTANIPSGVRETATPLSSRKFTA
jgi:hypothetical protein